MMILAHKNQFSQFLIWFFFHLFLIPQTPLPKATKWWWHHTLFPIYFRLNSSDTSFVMTHEQQFLQQNLPKNYCGIALILNSLTWVSQEYSWHLNGLGRHTHFSTLKNAIWCRVFWWFLKLSVDFLFRSDEPPKWVQFHPTSVPPPLPCFFSLYVSPLFTQVFWTTQKPQTFPLFLFEIVSVSIDQPTEENKSKPFSWTKSEANFAPL